MKKYQIYRAHMSKHSVQRGSAVLDLLDALAGALQLVLSGDLSFSGNARLRGQQLVKPARRPISGVVGFFMVRPAFPRE
jgi:hypothetical protein